MTPQQLKDKIMISSIRKEDGSIEIRAYLELRATSIISANVVTDHKMFMDVLDIEGNVLKDLIVKDLYQDQKNELRWALLNLAHNCYNNSAFGPEQQAGVIEDILKLANQQEPEIPIDNNTKPC